MCDYLHDASSARSRNRMRQSQAKVVPSKSALRPDGEEIRLEKSDGYDIEKSE